MAGCAVAFAGCVLIGLGNSREGHAAGLGIALLIVAAFAYATAVVIQKPVLARVSPLQVTWLGCAAGAVVCLPFAPTLVGELDDAGAGDIGWIDLPRRRADGARLRDLVVRLAAHERRPLGLPCRT